MHVCGATLKTDLFKNSTYLSTEEYRKHKRLTTEPINMFAYCSETLQNQRKKTFTANVQAQTSLAADKTKDSI